MSSPDTLSNSTRGVLILTETINDSSVLLTPLQSAMNNAIRAGRVACEAWVTSIQCLHTIEEYSKPAQMPSDFDLRQYFNSVGLFHGNLMISLQAANDCNYLLATDPNVSQSMVKQVTHMQLCPGLKVPFTHPYNAELLPYRQVIQDHNTRAGQALVGVRLVNGNLNRYLSAYAQVLIDILINTHLTWYTELVDDPHRELCSCFWPQTHTGAGTQLQQDAALARDGLLRVKKFVEQYDGSTYVPTDFV